MEVRARAVALIGSLLAAGPVAAQNLPHRDAVQWREVGVVDDFIYSIDETSFIRDGDRLTVLLRGSAPSQLDGEINTVVGRLTLDCRRRLVALGARDYYREVSGFAEASKEAGRLTEPTDPGQILLLDRLCVAQP